MNTLGKGRLDRSDFLQRRAYFHEAIPRPGSGDQTFAMLGRRQSLSMAPFYWSKPSEAVQFVADDPRHKITPRDSRRRDDREILDIEEYSHPNGPRAIYPCLMFTSADNLRMIHDRSRLGEVQIDGGEEVVYYGETDLPPDGIILFVYDPEIEQERIIHKYSRILEAAKELVNYMQSGGQDEVKLKAYEYNSHKINIQEAMRAVSNLETLIAEANNNIEEKEKVVLELASKYGNRFRAPVFDIRGNMLWPEHQTFDEVKEQFSSSDSEEENPPQK